MSENRDEYRTESTGNSGELKRCLLCGKPPSKHENYDENKKVACINPSCEMWCEWIPEYKWQHRPIEDALSAKVAQLEAKLAALKEATRWIPLSNPPKTNRMLILSQRTEETISMGAGLPYTTGWYCKESGEYVTNQYINWTHWKYIELEAQS